MSDPFEIVCEDTGALERSDWLKLRRDGLGSSDAAPALGLSPWRSQYELWAEKRGLLEDRPDNARFRGGRFYEEPTLRLWCEDSGVAFESIRRHVMVRSTAHPFMLANPDGLTDDAVIEVKTAHSMDQRHWDGGIPDQYVIQGLHLMCVTGRQRCIFPVAFTWDGPVEFVVDYDEKTADAMVAVEAEMWRRIQENDPPDPDGSESSMMALREQYMTVEQGESVEIGPEGLALVQEREIAVATAKTHTVAAERCKAALMQMLGHAEIGTVYGETVVTWKGDKKGNRRMYFPERSE